MATLTFDPGETTELEVFNDPSGVYSIPEGGMAFPAPPLETVTAGSIDTEGDQVAARRHQNRQIPLTVHVRESPAADLRAAVATLEATISKLARSGGELEWVNDDGDTFTFDVLAADGYDFPYDIAYENGLAIVSVTLTALPYARGVEVSTGSTHTETTLPVLLFNETGIPGDVPALGRLTINEEASSAQAYVVWGIQARYYSANADAALFFQGESLLTAGVTSTAVAGASGGNAAVKGTVGTSWANVILKQGLWVGGFRIIARVQVPATNTGTVSVRLAWNAGNRRYNYNPPVEMDPTQEGSWRLVDLGNVSLPDPLYGAANPTIAVQAQGTVGADDVYVDWVMLVPTDEGTGQADYVDSVPALNADGSLLISHDRVINYSPVSGWGAPDTYEGDYLRIPVDYPTVRFIVKASRNLLNTGDTNIDDISADVFITPRWLTIR